MIHIIIPQYIVASIGQIIKQLLEPFFLSTTLMIIWTNKFYSAILSPRLFLHSALLVYVLMIFLSLESLHWTNFTNDLFFSTNVLHCRIIFISCNSVLYFFFLMILQSSMFISIKIYSLYSSDIRWFLYYISNK